MYYFQLDLLTPLLRNIKPTSTIYLLYSIHPYILVFLTVLQSMLHFFFNANQYECNLRLLLEQHRMNAMRAQLAAC